MTCPVSKRRRLGESSHFIRPTAPALPPLSNSDNGTDQYHPIVGAAPGYICSAHANTVSTLDLFAFSSAAFAAASRGRSAEESISISSSASTLASPVVEVVRLKNSEDWLFRSRSERTKFWKFLGLVSIAVDDADVSDVAASSSGCVE